MKPSIYYRYIAIAMIFLGSSVLFAQTPAGPAAKPAPGVILRQFRMAEEFQKSRTNSDAERKRVLEANLVRGMRQTVNRSFYQDQQSYLKDLNPTSISYENPTSPLVFYVKFKNLIVRFDFTSDPELNIQAPILKKILILDPETQQYIEKRLAESPSGDAPAP
jgi:hypothetical protein